MKIFQFIAENAALAVEQIRRQLGPAAIIVNVRQLPAEGLTRFWTQPRIEVLAGVPDSPAASETLTALSGETISPVTSAQPPRLHAPLNLPESPFPGLLKADELFERGAADGAGDPVKFGHPEHRWRMPGVLREMGLAPLHVHHFLEHLQARHGEQPPAALRDEIALACSVLAELWGRTPQAPAVSSLHAFVGPSGSGKTTVICKWLTQATLLAGHSARVWRLDGATANTAESLSVYGEILGVPVARSLTFEEGAPADVGFIDLPGVDWKDASAMRDLAQRVAGLPPTQVHLVLNAAYESSILLAQAQAFRQLPVQDVVLTHLDEESRWGKLWNLVLGTNYRVGWLSAGQNIPGTFIAATAEDILSRQFAMK